MQFLKGFLGILILNAVVAGLLLFGGFMLAGISADQGDQSQSMLYAILGILGSFGITVLQAVYVIPIALHFKRKQEAEVLKGVLIGAGLTLLSPVLICGGASALGPLLSSFGS